MLNAKVVTGDGAMGAYVAMPKNVTGPAPAVVILMEVFGVNRFIRRIADHWAEQGLIVLAPDLYWRIRPGIELDPETDGHREQALKTREGMDVDLAATDVEAWRICAVCRNVLARSRRLDIASVGCWPISPACADRQMQMSAITALGSKDT